MKCDLCVLCIAVFVLAMGTTTLHAQNRLVLGYRGDTKALHAVISTRIITEAYGRMGIEIEAQGFPGPRSQSKANRGAIDGELFEGNISRDEFPNLIQVPVPILYSEIVVFTKDVEFKVMGWDSLKPYKIGIQIGIKEAESGTNGLQLEPVASAEQLFMKLAAGRNDIVVLPRNLGLKVLKTVGTQRPEGINLKDFQGITALDPPLQREALYHYLHSKHAEIVPKITAVLQEMEKEGLIQRIKEEVEANFFK